MINVKYFNQAAFTLLELLLVLLVISIFLFLSVNRYFQYKRATEIAIIQNNINELWNGYNLYYHWTCRANQNFTQQANMPTLMQTLAHNGVQLTLTKTNLIATQEDGYDYAISAKLVGYTLITRKPIYQLAIHAQLKVPQNAITTYQNLLNASYADGTTLTWLRMPSYSIPHLQGNLWILTTGLRFFKEAATINDLTCGY